LPRNIRRLAQKAYLLFDQNPHDPQLRFERKHGIRNIWSVRIGTGYRALGVMPQGNQEIVWFFIGSHADYSKLLP
jgi:hypothetical protein